MRALPGTGPFLSAFIFRSYPWWLAAPQSPSCVGGHYLSSCPDVLFVIGPPVVLVGPSIPGSGVVRVVQHDSEDVRSPEALDCMFEKFSPRASRAHHEKHAVGVARENLRVGYRQDGGGVEHDKPEFEAQPFHEPAHLFRSQDAHGILEVRSAG